MKDFLGKEANVGDIVVGCFSRKYNELTTQRIVKITNKTVFVKPIDETNCLKSQEKYSSNQFIIIKHENNIR